MLPTLKVLRGLGGAAPIDEIQDRVAWARSRMKPAGLVGTVGRGVWVPTDPGRRRTGRSPG